MTLNLRRTLNTSQEFLERFSELKNDAEGSYDERILDFLQFYETNNNNIHPDIIRKVIFFKLPELCFLKHIRNSSVVAKVLLTIHSLYNIAMPNIVMFLVLNSVLHRTLPHTIPEHEKNRKTFNYAAFFLHHSNVNKLIFDGKRITEMIELANPALYARLLVYSEWKCVLTLLQYGLRFDTDRKDFKMHGLFEYIFGHLTEFGKGMVHQNEELTENPDLYPNQLVKLLKNFKIILRSTYNPINVICQMVSLSEEESTEVAKILFEFFRFLFPGIDFKVRSVPALKHICRYVIREKLFQSWNLPHGICYLPLEDDLANYIHLCTD